MAERGISAPNQEGITALTFDGSTKTLNALSELYILQEAAGRWAFNKGLDLDGEDVRPSDMFDIIGGTGMGGFYAVLFASLKMTIKDAIQSHLLLEQRLFSSDAWKQKIQQTCVETLNSTLNQIVKDVEVETALDSPFRERNVKTKCIICVINPVAATSCRLLRNYRPRTGQSPQCTIRQVLHATLSNQAQLPTIGIQDERFLCALNGYANPTHVLVKELCNAFAKGTEVACLVNIGAGRPCGRPLTDPENVEQLSGLLQSCQLVAEDVAAQCHSLGHFFFRLSVSLGLDQEPEPSEEDISYIKGLSMAYLSEDAISTLLDSLEESLCEHFGAVSIERLNSVAGKDGESRVAARLAKVEKHLDDTIFRDVNTWLQPIHQASKLDANIQARSGTTCRWLFENSTFMQWVREKSGLFWFHGLMGTGKTVMRLNSSFVIETLRTRDDIRVAYYYFEYTNPATLSEETVHRSLVSQLAGVAPSVVRALHQKHDSGGLQPQLSALQNALKELVAASQKPVFIVIDALDEIPFPQRKYLLQSLVTFSASNSASQTHVMVTSREEVDIHRAFEGKVDFELRVQGDLVRQDIAAFVDRQLEAAKWIFWPRDEIDLMRRLLNERADGQFRMVACQMDVLQRVKTLEQLQQCLHSLPKTLSDTYDYILGKIPEEFRAQSRRLFAILSFATKFISLFELSALLAVEFPDDEDSDQLPEFRERNKFLDPLDVVDMGTSLVSQIKVDGFPCLQLAHASVKEHFLAPCEAWFFLCEDLAQSMIASACLALLLHFPILQHETGIGELNRYSRDCWYKHILSNGHQGLLHQQQHLFASFPWPYSSSLFQLVYKRTQSQLVSAVSLGLFDLVGVLLNTRVWKTDDLDQALVEATISGRPSMSLPCCHLLHKYGANVNAFVENMSPLQGASVNGNLEVVRFLVEKEAAVNAVGGFYGTALAASAFGGNLEIVRFFVEKEADVNAVGGYYGTALTAGAYAANLEVVRFLFEKGADINIGGGSYGTTLRAGVYGGNLEVVRFLVEKGADMNAAGQDFGALATSALSGNLEVARLLVKKGAEVNAVVGSGETVLGAGAYNGNLEVARLLIENGADVNAAGGQYGTALGFVASRGNSVVVRFLVENGADVNAAGGDYGTALGVAAFHGNPEVVQILLENGAQINAVGGKYGTALGAAAFNGNPEVVRFLIENGADVNAAGGNYGTALGAAASRGNSVVVQFLIENGADVNIVGGEYGTVLGAAAFHGNPKVVQILIENRADVNAGGGEYGTALGVAASHGNLRVVRLLVEKGADVNGAGEKHATPLDAAIAWSPRYARASIHETMVRFLKSHGARTWEEISKGKREGRRLIRSNLKTAGQ
ncbi:ankyrin repeat-containing domain protein [Flagelloscypha sp. PMI_526]|nr:ankyrin repeat-containing domain protein [Flagelloscypha sp. PMI_526]